MKKFVVTVIGSLLAFGTSTVSALPDNVVGFPQTLKAKKLQTDLVPAYACGDDDADPGCSGSLLVGGGGAGTTDPAPGNQTKSKKTGNNCTFQSGTVKMQVGKDTQVQLKGVACGGDPPINPDPLKEGGSLCGQTIAYSTLSNVLIDKKNVVTEIEPCGTTASGFIQGSSNYTTAIVAATIGPCAKGTCKGVLSSAAQQSENPCPQSDTISETRRIEIFDGGDVAKLSVLGAELSVCCGLNQQIVPGVGITQIPQPSLGCNNRQDVLAVPGSVSRGTP